MRGDLCPPPPPPLALFSFFLFLEASVEERALMASDGELFKMEYLSRLKAGDGELV